MAGERGDRLVHLRFDLQKAARGLHIDLPGRGERDGRCAALKDGRAELLLDLPNLLGERRLGDEERFGRRGEAAFARDGEHELSVSGIHEHLREGRGERLGRRPKPPAGTLGSCTSRFHSLRE